MRESIKFGSTFYNIRMIPFLLEKPLWSMWWLWKACLEGLSLSSGLKSIFFKSWFDTIGVLVENMEMYTQLLNCLTLDFSFVYLGIPIAIGTNPRKPIVDKYAKICLVGNIKLCVWRGECVSLISFCHYLCFSCLFLEFLGGWANVLFKSKEIFCGYERKEIKFVGKVGTTCVFLKRKGVLASKVLFVLI